MRLRSIIASCCTSLAIMTMSVAPGGATVVPADVSAFSSHQIFEGVFYGEGPVAKLLPEVWNRDTRHQLGIDRFAGTQAYHAVISRVERRLSAVDPKLFSEYTSEMTSGDPGRVQAAIERTKLDIQRISVASARSKVDGPNLYPETINTNVNINNTVLGFEVCLIIAALVAAVVLAVAMWVIAVPADERQAGYGKDASIALITTRLRG